MRTCASALPLSTRDSEFRTCLLQSLFRSRVEIKFVITMSASPADPRSLSRIFAAVPREEKKKWIDEFLQNVTNDDLTLISTRASFMRTKRPARVQSGAQSIESPGPEPEDNEGVSCMKVPFIFPGRFPKHGAPVAIDCEGIKVQNEVEGMQDLAASIAIVDRKGELLFHCFVNHGTQKVNDIRRATGIEQQDMRRSCVTIPWLKEFLKEFTKHGPLLVGAGLQNEYKFLQMPPYKSAVDIQDFYYREKENEHGQLVHEPISLELLGERFREEIKWKKGIGQQHQAIHDARLTMKLYNLYMEKEGDPAFIAKIRTTGGYTKQQKEQRKRLFAQNKW